jgi:hypothetical protein
MIVLTAADNTPTADTSARSGAKEDDLEQVPSPYDHHSKTHHDRSPPGPKARRWSALAGAGQANNQAGAVVAEWPKPERLAQKSSDRRYGHRQATPRPKRVQRFNIDCMAGKETQPETLCDHREHNLHLGGRQLAADARTRPAAEGNVSKARPQAGSTGQEPLGPKPFRIVPKGGVMLQDIGAEDDGSTRRDHVLAHPVRLDRRSGEPPSGREKPERLLRHRTRKREAV